MRKSLNFGNKAVYLVESLLPRERINYKRLGDCSDSKVLIRFFNHRVGDHVIDTFFFLFDAFYRVKIVLMRITYTEK